MWYKISLFFAFNSGRYATATPSKKNESIKRYPLNSSEIKHKCFLYSGNPILDNGLPSYLVFTLQMVGLIIWRFLATWLVWPFRWHLISGPFNHEPTKYYLPYEYRTIPQLWSPQYMVINLVYIVAPNFRTVSKCCQIASTQLVARIQPWWLKG